MGDNEIILGAVNRSPGIYLMAEENQVRNYCFELIYNGHVLCKDHNVLLL